jgi:hypothetical protein
MIKITQEKLDAIIELHTKWLDEKEKITLNASRLFKCLNLNKYDLNSANLKGVDLRYADVINVKLNFSDLSNSNLSYADLKGTDLSYANLSNADLSFANLTGVNLRGADLRGAKFHHTKGILCFFLGNHPGFYTPHNRYCQIGCEYMRIDKWVKRYKEIGKYYDYSKFEIKLYGKILKALSKHKP